MMRKITIRQIATTFTFFWISFILPLGDTGICQQGREDNLATVRELEAAGEFDRALQILQPLMQNDPDDYGLLCWMAEIQLGRSEVILRDVSPQEAKAVCQEAVRYARRAAEVEPDSAWGWFQVGQTTGMLSKLPGGRETVEMAAEAKSAFERAISIDPDYTSAIHGLARWHHAVANLSGAMKMAAKVFYGGLPSASNEEAVRLFQRAIRLEPDVILHHLELGKTYLEMREKALARAEFETVLRLPVVYHLDPSRKETARRLLSEMR
ncbi:tetratricopeptide repeat protein [Candidatus Zixiibacteriota bacterium]